MQRTVLFAAQPVAVLILMAQDVFQAATTHYIPRLPPGDPLCGFAPVYNPALTVTDVNAVTQAIQNYFSRCE
jgi:hypothetical protein